MTRDSAEWFVGGGPEGEASDGAVRKGPRGSVGRGDLPEWEGDVSAGTSLLACGATACMVLGTRKALSISGLPNGIPLARQSKNGCLHDKRFMAMLLTSPGSKTSLRKITWQGKCPALALSLQARH